MNVASVQTIIKSLNDAGVRYLVAGGLATVAHGHVRFTADLDLILDLGGENLRVATEVFSGLGFRPRAPVPLEDFVKKDNRESWLRDKGLTVFSLWSDRFPMTEVDLFIEEPFENMEVVFGKAVRREIGPGVEAPVVSRGDLIAMKRVAGRQRDLDDIEALERLAEGGE